MPALRRSTKPRGLIERRARVGPKHVQGDRPARDLIEEKLIVRQLEQASTKRHMERLRNRTAESIETSEIHLDAVRDLVQINTLLTSVAYPILEESGELLDSRLASARP